MKYTPSYEVLDQTATKKYSYFRAARDARSGQLTLKKYDTNKNILDDTDKYSVNKRIIKTITYAVRRRK